MTLPVRVSVEAGTASSARSADRGRSQVADDGKGFESLLKGKTSSDEEKTAAPRTEGKERKAASSAGQKREAQTAARTSRQAAPEVDARADAQTDETDTDNDTRPRAKSRTTFEGQQATDRAPKIDRHEGKVATTQDSPAGRPSSIEGPDPVEDASAKAPKTEGQKPSETAGQEDGEAGTNRETSPFLRSRLALDRMFGDFASSSFMQGSRQANALPGAQQSDIHATRSLFAPITVESDPGFRKIFEAETSARAVTTSTVALQLSAEENARRLGILLPEETAKVEPKQEPLPTQNGRVIVTVGRPQLVVETPQDETAGSSTVSPDAKLAAILGGFGLASQAAGTGTPKLEDTADTGETVRRTAPGEARAPVEDKGASAGPAPQGVQADATVSAVRGVASDAILADTRAGSPLPADPRGNAASATIASGSMGKQGAAAASDLPRDMPSIAPKMQATLREQAMPGIPASRASASQPMDGATRPTIATTTHVPTEGAEKVVRPSTNGTPASIAGGERTLGLGGRVDMVSMRTDFEPSSRRSGRTPTPSQTPQAPEPAAGRGATNSATVGQPSALRASEIATPLPGVDLRAGPSVGVTATVAGAATASVGADRSRASAASRPVTAIEPAAARKSTQAAASFNQQGASEPTSPSAAPRREASNSPLEAGGDRRPQTTSAEAGKTPAANLDASRRTLPEGGVRTDMPASKGAAATEREQAPSRGTQAATDGSRTSVRDATGRAAAVEGRNASQGGNAGARVENPQGDRQAAPAAASRSAGETGARTTAPSAGNAAAPIDVASEMPRSEAPDRRDMVNAFESSASRDATKDETARAAGSSGMRAPEGAVDRQPIAPRDVFQRAASSAPVAGPSSDPQGAGRGSIDAANAPAERAVSPARQQTESLTSPGLPVREQPATQASQAGRPVAASGLSSADQSGMPAAASKDHTAASRSDGTPSQVQRSAVSGEASAARSAPPMVQNDPLATSGSQNGPNARENVAAQQQPRNAAPADAGSRQAEAATRTAPQPAQNAASTSEITRLASQDVLPRMSELGNLVRDGKKAGEVEMPSNRPVGKGEANVDTLEQAFAKPTVSNQVAKAVSNALSQMVPASDHSASAERTRLRAGGAALKTIQIQLAPETLGKVNVTLKLIDGQLAVHIEATEAEAAASLKDDTEGLKTLLKSAGLDVDEATVTLGSRDAAATKAGSGQGQTQGEASLSNQSRGEQGAGSNGQSSSQGGDQRQGASRQQGRPFDGDRSAADNRPGQNREGPYVYL